MHFLRVVLYCVLLIFSLNSLAASAPFIMPEPRTKIEQQDLAKYFSDKLIELETDNGKVTTLFSPYMSSSKRGVVILLPSAGHGPLSVHGLSYLSQALTDDGFDTYALQTPELNWQADLFNIEPATPDKEQVYEGPWSEAMLDDYKEQLLSSFDALYQQLVITNQDQVVVVAQGVSAGVFSEYLASLPKINIDAFIAISAQLPNISRNKHLPAVLSLVSPPLLDIIYSLDNPTIHHNAKQRKRWVLRNNKYDYRQRELFGLSTEPRQHERLRKELDGFLRQL
ncbi:DUF3530 family protein [Pseudoalteromonas sp. JBTF-M23]|uniref:DUF3530 family protein n=1 Tax=Pseudoalteromonas caenipelagi TaxID=2726988 RepID=A0A849VL54_9GAMM|nr:DUF3530 family protein [Pseudoalteromonas caenipelagi]NOU52421.1 DUF3530 family protein [Pseudoalteromonas caenipelagi]